MLARRMLSQDEQKLLDEYREERTDN